MADEINTIKEKGWTVIKDYCSQLDVEAIRKTLYISDLNVNNNDALPIQKGGYITNKDVLAYSKEVFEATTKLELRNIASSLNQEEPILKTVRTYSIKKRDPRFPWHADNILPNGRYDSSKGIVCILYLVDDIEEGTFWLSSFNTWDSKRNELIFPTSSDFSKWEKGLGITKIYARKGDLFIFNQNLFHRHISMKKDIDALFFQIIGKSSEQTEKLCIDPSMIRFDKDLISYLGSGKENVGHRNPVTKINDLPPNKLIRIAFKCICLIPASLKNHSIIISKIKYNLYWKKQFRIKKIFKKLFN